MPKSTMIIEGTAFESYFMLEFIISTCLVFFLILGVWRVLFVLLLPNVTQKQML